MSTVEDMFFSLAFRNIWTES